MREVVRQNPPVIYGRYVSWDEKGALITANFVTDRLSGREAYEAVFKHIQQIKADEQDADHADLRDGRADPRRLGPEARLRDHPLRTADGRLSPSSCSGRTSVAGTASFIPMIAATATVIWGLGYTGWRGITFDPLILVIPMLITARATSHTVQMAERFFEDYELMLPLYADADLAKREVATVAMSELIVPGTLGILVDVAGLLVVMVTTIPQMFYLGEFGAVWVTSILFTVEILHPILICYLPAPTEHEHFLPGFMVRALRWVGWVTTHPTWKYVVGGTAVTLLAVSTYLTLVPLPDRRSQPRHHPVLAEPRVQRIHQAGRRAVRRRGHAHRLRGRRQGQRLGRLDSDPAHGGVRALDDEVHAAGRVALGGAVPARLLATEPLRRPDLALHPRRLGDGADDAVPAPHQRPAGLPAAVHDRRWALREHLVHLPGSQGRHDHEHAGRRRRVHRPPPDGRGDRAPRQGPGRGRRRRSGTSSG